MRPFVLTAIAACALSLLGMWAGETFLSQRVAVVGSFAGLTLSHNPGIAFGIRLPDYVQELAIVAALGWMAFLAVRRATSSVQRVAFGFIVGGALGNLIDRFHDGVVTDYVQVGTFPIFNVADSFITIGVLFLLAEVAGMVPNTRAARQNHL